MGQLRAQLPLSKSDGGDLMTKTQYPIVLVHGMMAKDFRLWRAFRGISHYLRGQGITVYVTNQDGVGAVATNAQQLKEEILTILQKEKCEKVNLIAHSKGGVDCRQMITHLDMAQHVASLTTLSTPHHGSGLSEKLLKMPRFMAKIIAFCYNVFFRICGDRKPDMLQLGLDLTPEAMARFNESTPDMPCVYYQSYSSSVTKKNSITFIPCAITRRTERDMTDGVVSVSSSQWGEYQEDIGNNLDHFKMVGLYGSKKKLAEVGKFYLYIIEQLREKGF